MTYMGAEVLKIISIAALSILFAKDILEFVKDEDKSCEISSVLLLIIFLYVVNR